MSHQENARPAKVPVRTIIAAIAMFAGIVLMGYGYFGNQQVMIYVGLATTLSGVMTAILAGILGSPRGQH